MRSQRISRLLRRRGDLRRQSAGGLSPAQQARDAL